MRRMTASENRYAVNLDMSGQHRHTRTSASRRAGRLALAVMMAIGLIGVRAHAQGVSDNAELERSAQARALFEEGLGLAAHKTWELAADRFRRSNALRESPVVEYNLAASLAELGHLVAASELLRQLDSAPSTSAEVRSAARTLLATTQPRLAKLTVVVDGDRSGVRVMLDDAPLHDAVLGVAIPADPGAHHVSALRSGKTLATETLTLADGGSATARLDLQTLAEARLEAALAAPTAPRPRASIAKKWWFWTAVVGVVAAASVATVLVVSGNHGATP